VSRTRERILATAREITEKQGAFPSMSALARAVGISRQALYLHFPDRTELLLAYVAYHDDREQLAAGLATVRDAPDAAGRIRAWAHMQTWHNLRIAAVARALDATRHDDQAAAAGWDDRSADRMRDATAIVERLRAEGRLHPSWADDEAAVLLRELTSFRVWDDLVNDARIAPDRYVEIITAAALSTLGAPVTQPASPANAEGVSPAS
jgi:AcrR family transcriptional regulator